MFYDWTPGHFTDSSFEQLAFSGPHQLQSLNLSGTRHLLLISVEFSNPVMQDTQLRYIISSAPYFQSNVYAPSVRQAERTRSDKSRDWSRIQYHEKELGTEKG